jgi:hypothetical protein
VPKFLQRGFLAEASPDAAAESTWWHFRGNPPKCLAITHVGVEEYFYSRLRRDGVPTLDDEITAREWDIQKELTNARSLPAGAVLDSNKMGKLVTHFALRAAFLRSVFSTATQRMTDEVIATVGSVRGARLHLGIDNLAMSDHVASIVASVSVQLHDAGVTIPEPLAERLLPYALRENFDALMAGVEPQLAKVQSELAKGLYKAIADAHRQVLAKENYAAWEAALARLTWRVHPIDSAVLPDCIAIARSQNHDWAPLLLAGIEDLRACVLPLDDSRILVGTTDPALLLDTESLNVACAMCSDQFFIAAQPMPILAGRLGSSCAELILSKVDDALQELRSDTTPDPTRVPICGASISCGAGQFEFALHLPGFENPTHGIVLQHIVIAVVRELSQTMPLESLDGITFAIDYLAAIEALDRGDENFVPDLCAPREYGVPVAKCVTVIRDGQRKQHLLFGWPIVEGLLSDNVTDQSASLHTLIVMLAHVAYDVSYVQPLAATVPPFPNDFTRQIYRAVAGAPCQYYSSRAAAFADPTAGLRYAELFRDCVHTTRRAMNAAHQEYVESGDVTVLLNTGLQHVGNLMEHAAQWCGHQDGLVLHAVDESEVHDTGEALMRETLMPSELEAWLSLLHQDMCELYNDASAFTAERLFALVRHVERLLWTYQIFPWPTADDGTYVTVVPPRRVIP